MTPIGNKIILEFDTDQKETIIYGSLKLYVPNRGGLNENARIGWATCARVVHPGISPFKENDIAVFSHTILDNPACWIQRDKNIITLTLPADGSETIYGKLGTRGEVIPMFKNVVVRRIDESTQSEIIITPDAYKKVEPFKAIVLASATDSKYHEGQIVLYYKYSDYELCYNINGEDRTAIMVKSSDIVGVYE